jgi:ABC-type transporter Mla maintaining outer membrane lipid asymmetry ATPase subunit MlaF
MAAPLLEIDALSMQYGALRPLRVQQLSVAAGEHVSLVGLDQPAAEVLINLVTGASLPNTGTVKVFGRLTAEISDSTDWLTMVDRFGIVSERAALLEPLTVIQNLAVPFSLEIEPPPPSIAAQARAIATESGLPDGVLHQRVGDLDATLRMRIRLARALALNPSVLLLEHPSAAMPRHDVARFAADVRSLAARRSLAALSITADRDFAAAGSTRTLVLEPATGRLRRA